MISVKLKMKKMIGVLRLNIVLNDRNHSILSTDYLILKEHEALG